MEQVTLVWSMAAAVVLTMAALSGLAWLGERRDLGKLVFLLIALGVVAGIRCEVGMMHAATADEFAKWLRWYHLPVFFVILGYVFLIRLYLGTGRMSLAWTIVSLRFVILVANFLVHPNSTWLEIDNLRHVTLLGEQVAVPGEVVARWQWLSTASLLLMIVYVTDACIERLRKPQPDSRRRVLTIFFALAAPMSAVILWTQLVLLGVDHLPVVASPWFLFTLLAMGFELRREIVIGARRRHEVMGLRGELAHVGRMTTLGQLASALAHELSQPLGAILRNAEAAELHLNSPSPDLTELRAIVSDIRKDDQRAGDVIERMRALIKRRTLAMNPLALDELLKGVISLVHSDARARHVALDCVVAAGLPLVSGDRVHLSQVLLNLIINSMDAMQTSKPDSKRVVIEARSREQGKVEVAVTDSGPGVPPEVINKVFEPFYTTKSEGLGMGLPISRTIIEAHGGRLWAERSAEGTGATFRFTLRPAA
jgi:signal transduction histidine kinase